MIGDAAPTFAPSCCFSHTWPPAYCALHVRIVSIDGVSVRHMAYEEIRKVAMVARRRIEQGDGPPVEVVVERDPRNAVAPPVPSSARSAPGEDAAPMARLRQSQQRHAGDSPVGRRGDYPSSPGSVSTSSLSEDQTSDAGSSPRYESVYGGGGGAASGGGSVTSRTRSEGGQSARSMPSGSVGGGRGDGDTGGVPVWLRSTANDGGAQGAATAGAPSKQHHHTEPHAAPPQQSGSGGGNTSTASGANMSFVRQADGTWMSVDADGATGDEGAGSSPLSSFRRPSSAPSTARQLQGDTPGPEHVQVRASTAQSASAAAAAAAAAAGGGASVLTSARSWASSHRNLARYHSDSAGGSFSAETDRMTAAATMRKDSNVRIIGSTVFRRRPDGSWVGTKENPEAVKADMAGAGDATTRSAPATARLHAPGGKAAGTLTDLYALCLHCDGSGCSTGTAVRELTHWLHAVLSAGMSNQFDIG